ncbi:triose-phosphate isomerase [bacterium]|nr:triose-phosphate isomerase [bacterium]
MRTPILAANWKMNLSRREAKNLVEDLLKAAYPVSGREVVLCPSFHLLTEVGAALQGRANYFLAAQNVYWKESGAYTGELSPAMLRDCGCTHVIIGHSERRAYFHETDKDCHSKVEAAMQNNLVPILCVGESLEQREADKTREVVLAQLQGALKGQSLSSGDRLVIAYEPIWAIGTGKTDTPEGAEQTISVLRQEVATMFGERIAQQVRLLYGGSVKADNIDSLMACTNIDGALVGGASLKADGFARIVNYQAQASLAN